MMYAYGIHKWNTHTLNLPLRIILCIEHVQQLLSAYLDSLGLSRRICVHAHIFGTGCISFQVTL